MKTHTGTGKRILSLILAVSMTFSMGLTSAFAANGSRATNSGDSGTTVDSGVISVTLDTESANVFVGEIIKIDATVLLDSGSTATKDVIWTSDKEKVATVDKNGFVTAVALDDGQIGSGYATITATSVSDPKKSDSATIYVSQVKDIKVAPEFVKLINGDTYQLKAELTIYSKSPTVTDTVTWWSDNKAVATVDQNGLVTTVGDGDAKIYAEADSDQAIQDYANITVRPVSLSIDATPASIDFGINLVGKMPNVQTVTVKNTGNRKVTLVQPTSKAYEVGKLSVLDLAVGKTATFTVKPLVATMVKVGEYKESIKISTTSTAIDTVDVKMLVISNDTSGGGNNNSSSGGTTPSAPSVTAPSDNVSANGEVKAESVKEETKTAIQDALKAAAAAGKPAAGGVTATVMVKNAESISAATLTEMAATAKAAGGKVELKADTVDATGAVTARLYIDPAAAAKLKGEIKLGVKTDEAATQATKEAFKNFDNKMAVASFAQQGSFGMAIKVAVKVDLTGLNTKTLVFTSFDKKTGKYVQLPKTAYTIDKNGYIHFTTSMGGEILITDKPLVKKAPAKAAAK
ncbi:MAG: Ig-like domain-containing protein [Hydrogenoanaerobacterium sp.]